MPQVGVDWKTLLVDWRTLQEEGRPAGLLRMLHALLLIWMCVCVVFVLQVGVDWRRRSK